LTYVNIEQDSGLAGRNETATTRDRPLEPTVILWIVELLASGCFHNVQPHVTHRTVLPTINNLRALAWGLQNNVRSQSNGFLAITTTNQQSVVLHWMVHGEWH